MNYIAKFKNQQAAHGYDIETRKGCIYVEAHNRAQAARIAEKNGYQVCSVNMVG